MKSYLAPLLGLAQGALATVQGFDISHYQSSVDFAAAKAAGARFVLIKVREHQCPTKGSRAPYFTTGTTSS